MLTTAFFVGDPIEIGPTTGQPDVRVSGLRLDGEPSVAAAAFEARLRAKRACGKSRRDALREVVDESSDAEHWDWLMQKQ
ncbi:hypothetical protein Thimo_2943 [Thioflavicoccus mobilis 8321]|uniref:Uncharacterized protein n=1 Tax=Thioflavicoccus mobilis 8321 TaxID=765912 RepID=L0H1V8_9GAMM|nr:hypothetical protein [Thioflavicoccus mobilis]AGA91635.1 hypothetical protein Thimo_2943 [Thioflavicoccus mobilis 8321]